MSNIITIGYSAEGTTDERFLESIIKRTFENIAFDCESIIEVFDPIYIDFPNEDGFVNGVKKLSNKAFEKGVNVLCIHTDADENTDNTAFSNKINPSLEAIGQCDGENVCKNIVAIVPIHMSEAWMLADKELFKSEVCTTKSNNDLGINRNPETIADPKTVIQEALRIAQEHLPTRRKKLTISEIYQPIGQNVGIDKLETLPSYLKFKNSVIQAFRKLNYLSD